MGNDPLGVLVNLTPDEYERLNKEAIEDMQTRDSIRKDAERTQ